jgi:hypothetical protein
MSVRRALNEVVPGKIYQRGQILSWSLADKRRLVKQNNISVVVNLWPKIDPDFSGDLVSWYMYMPVPRSKDMTSFMVRTAATAVARVLKKNKNSSTLVLCEAGKTRSVFFCVLLVSKLLDVSLKEAYERVTQTVPKHMMKKFMVDYVRNR